MTEGLSPADIAAVQGGGFGGFGNEGLWLFAILALMGGGFGSWGNRGAGDRNATVGDVQRATDFAALERQNNETVAAVRQAAYDNQAAVKDGNYNILGELRDLQAATAEGFAHQQECCCNILRGIDSVNYNGALNTASINANTTAQTQKILDALAQNKIETLQGRINQLEMQSALGNVVRYPTMMAYNAGVSPFCGGYTPCGGNANY